MTKNQKKIKPKKSNIDPEEMMRAGIHFGHRVSKRHPKMIPFIYGARNGIHVINLEKTVQFFEKALDFIQELILEEKTLLFVGTKIQHKDPIKEIAKECEFPYVTERWLGGTFTNFGNIRKRIEYFQDLKRKEEEGEFDKYTKKERAELQRELKNLEIKFGGIKNLTRLPDAVFVLDVKKDISCIKEARIKKIKIIGIADTNIDPTLVDYPIPANDDAISSVRYILEKVKEVVLSARQKTISKQQTISDEEEEKPLVSES